MVQVESTKELKHCNASQLPYLIYERVESTKELKHRDTQFVNVKMPLVESTKELKHR